MPKDKDSNPDEKNPIDPRQKNMGRVAPELETDDFTADEQSKIVQMIMDDAATDMLVATEWAEQRKKDIQMYEGARPSIIEGLDKFEWMSDRNMGLTSSNCDAYQATLLATTYNVDTLHFVDDEENDIDHKEDLVKFSKWGLDIQEANFTPEVDDFIHNKITQGVSFFKVYWKVWYEWVDRRIPKKNILGKFKGYEIKTERVRFEKGVIENIPDVSDLMFPDVTGDLQTEPHLIHIIHKTSRDIEREADRGLYVNVDDKFLESINKVEYDYYAKRIKDEKRVQLGVRDAAAVAKESAKSYPLDLYEWYGPYEKNGREEEYRFIIEPTTRTFLAGKPLRKITRSGKRPFVGRPFIRRPGFIRGKSLPRLIQDPSNALNNIYNQKSDFQYVENCPFGFYNPDEVHQKQVRDLVPGKMYPTTDVNSINFPNLSRSFSWATEDFNLFFEMTERMTGAASYFMSNDRGISGTATRDKIIENKSDTRFGVWVSRLQEDIAEAITMWIEMYQDWAPPDLGMRVIGEDGKKLFPNLSIETLRGKYRARLAPDIISGSKQLDREIALWGLETLSQTVWFNPSINPKGNWKLAENAAKKMGFANIESYMPPEPKAQFGKTKLVTDKWTQLKQGQEAKLEEGEDPIELFMGFSEIKDTRMDELDPEYIDNFESFYFKLFLAMNQQVKQAQNEQMANQMAGQMISDIDNKRTDPNEVLK